MLSRDLVPIPNNARGWLRSASRYQLRSEQTEPLPIGGVENWRPNRPAHAPIIAGLRDTFRRLLGTSPAHDPERAWVAIRRGGGAPLIVHLEETRIRIDVV
jgi:hypothetical protein